MRARWVWLPEYQQRRSHCCRRRWRPRPFRGCGRRRDDSPTGWPISALSMSCRCERDPAPISKNAPSSASCATSRPAHAHSPPTPNATNRISPSSSARSTTASSTSPGSGRSQPRSCSPATPRFKHEAAFARCNGTAPLPASSGKTVRHRLNRGGDRQVNNAIHTIAVIRAKHQPETRAYLDRRISEGKTKREALRALKRHISRDLFKRLSTVPLTS